MYFNQISTIHKCWRCGAKFNTQYYNEGSKHHESQTSDWNLTVAIRRGGLYKRFEQADKKAKKCIKIWCEMNGVELKEGI